MRNVQSPKSRLAFGLAWSVHKAGTSPCAAPPCKALPSTERKPTCTPNKSSPNICTMSCCWPWPPYFSSPAMTPPTPRASARRRYKAPLPLPTPALQSIQRLLRPALRLTAPAIRAVRAAVRTAPRVSARTTPNAAAPTGPSATVPTVTASAPMVTASAPTGPSATVPTVTASAPMVTASAPTGPSAPAAPRPENADRPNPVAALADMPTHIPKRTADAP